MEEAIARYLRELEHALLARGLGDRDALDDARESLPEELELWRQRRRGPVTRDAAYDHLVIAFGDPGDVAAEYFRLEEGEERSRRGHPFNRARHWWLTCRRCGRSRPAESSGGLLIRWGARSWHKYILGYCRGCHRVRFLRYERRVGAVTGERQK